MPSSHPAFYIILAFGLCLAVGFATHLTLRYFALSLELKKMYSQKEKLLQVQYEKNVLDTQLEMQEQTLQHISREIHDNINLSLVLANLQLRKIDWTSATDPHTKVAGALEALSKAINDLRSLSHGLGSEIIIKYGLYEALAAEMERVRQTGLFALEYIIKGEAVFLSTPDELLVFRIVQECLNNTIKHAAASQVSLTLQYTASNLSIQVTDNGRGFRPEDVQLKQCLGLANIKKRAASLNATLKIDSHPGTGTSIHLVIPIRHDQ